MERYSNIGISTLDIGQRYLKPVFYPNVEESEDDIYIITTEGDRYDNISLQFYGREDYWWIIMAANSLESAGGSLVIQPGVQVRIPADPEEYVRRYQELNS